MFLLETKNNRLPARAILLSSISKCETYRERGSCIPFTIIKLSIILRLKIASSTRISISTLEVSSNNRAMNCKQSAHAHNEICDRRHNRCTTNTDAII